LRIAGDRAAAFFLDAVRCIHDVISVVGRVERAAAAMELLGLHSSMEGQQRV
jgi:hypothetical protein